MIDPRLDDALEAATEKARLFTTDTLAGEYVDGWRQAIEALRKPFLGASDARPAWEVAITDFCNAMVRE